jgi:UDP-N-acetylmuramoyl-L-alanyl-D-glutamate--2,6-diaminopimelate ligase
VKSPGALSLAEIARELPAGVEIQGDGGVRVSGVQQDSRHVGAGDLFVARSGAHANGAHFMEEARARGAVAMMTDREVTAPEGVPVLRVDDVPSALAFAAAAVYGHPSFSLDLVGVTGTNGKSTTTHLVRALVEGALGGPRCGIIGTVGHEYAGTTFPASHTTPEADELARILAAFRDRGASHVAMEVSSIAIATGRVRAMRFRVAAFTNLTQDHLDFHGSMDRYAASKAKLFTEYAPGTAVINVDDAFGRELVAKVRAPLVRVSARSVSAGEAEIAPKSVRLSDRGIQATLRTPQGEVALSSRLLGAYNVENLLLALGIAHALEIDLHAASLALRDEKAPRGRLERCESPEDDVVVLVDYAHTPDALARSLDAVRAFTHGRVLCVFGCGGNRDTTKRAPMGRAAASLADVVIVTNDNPRLEVPDAIAVQIVEGLVSADMPAMQAEDVAGARRGYMVELDRARAIECAVMGARTGDVVLIAGKGHESAQVIGTKSYGFDDKTEAEKALSKRRRRGPTAD